MRYYLAAIADVMDSVKSSFQGLSSNEAGQRLAQNGKNQLQEGKKDSLFKRFLGQMMDPMILILLAAAAISAILTVYESRVAGHAEFPSDVLIILAVVTINAILGVYQESKAEAAIEALQQMAAATSKVLRDGAVQSVKSEELVVGDVVLLEAGDAVPADARVFECASLQVEEAALTGESAPITKQLDKLALAEHSDVALGDRTNMVYMGSTIAYGRGKAVVVATGMQTEMGKIAEAIARADEGLTPLQIKLNQLSKLLTTVVLGVCIFIFGFNIVRNILDPQIPGVGGIDALLDMFMVAVSLAVAAIPEGLVAVVTIVLSIGVTHMSKKRAIIRKLTAVETLGCAQVICSDKTGTLTQNKMTVVDHYAPDEGALATAMALCCDAQLTETGAIGEPTEVALVQYASALHLPKQQLEETAPRVAEAPFDSMRKMMSTVHETGGGFVQYTKGAPDEILARCTAVQTNAGAVPITEALREEILAQNQRMAGGALRVLAAAKREHPALPGDCSGQALEQQMTFLGLAGMMDPVRPEVKNAVEECHSAGIRVVMITGDHRDTAVAIAAQLGILESGLKAITGAQLSQIGDEEFEQTVGEYAVYARVQPEHKVRIVNAWRKNGMVTAMTGDGVNDAPSIKSADIGVGMGITGTDVTKNVADMVLADDNFATIVSAVGAGRKIYANIRKAIQFLLGSNMSEVLTIFSASLLGITVLKPVHLLWINLVTDCFPALALGMEKPEHDIMRRAPRSAKEGVFANGVGFDLAYQGAFVSILVMAAFFVGEFLQNGAWHFRNISQADGAEGMTMAFFTMCMAEMFHSLNMRSQRGSLFTMARKSGVNWWLWGSFALSLALSTAVVCTPFTRTLFQFSDHFTALEYGVSLLLAFLIIPMVEFVKLLQRLSAKQKS